MLANWSLFTTVLNVEEGQADPQCGVWIGKPGISSCEDNPLVADQYATGLSTPTQNVLCLRNADLFIDLNGDGIEESGGPILTVTGAPC